MQYNCRAAKYSENAVLRALFRNEEANMATRDAAAQDVVEEKSLEEESLWKRLVYILKRDWKTIPNFLSYLRLAMIPLFIWLYIWCGNYDAAAVVVVVSGITDVLDGYIARHYNMVSDLGKVLDPAADKLSQIAMFICLSVRYKLALVLVCIIIAKELTMFILGMIVFKKSGNVYSANWYGKVTTFVILATSFILLIFSRLDPTIANALLLLSIIMALFSYLMYGIYYIKLLLKISGKK